jgi:hypothetical protein
MDITVEDIILILTRVPVAIMARAEAAPVLMTVQTAPEVPCVAMNAAAEARAMLRPWNRVSLADK